MKNVFMRKPSPKVFFCLMTCSLHTIRFHEPIICGFYLFLLGGPTVFITLAVMKHRVPPEYGNAAEIAL